ncbi:MAG: hypothetical protein KAQ85_03080 [Thermodesulfovibrionia bacterium]|nr:hypothetical protein [Thermodesulfovibrionia bacterium]
MDRIKIKILEDGVVSIDTDAISKTNHVSADELMEMMEDMIGEVKVVEKKKVAHHHAHAHQHLHHKH